MLCITWLLAAAPAFSSAAGVPHEGPGQLREQALCVSCGCTGWAAGEFVTRNEHHGYNSTVDLIEAGTVEFEAQRHGEGFIEGSFKVSV